MNKIYCVKNSNGTLDFYAASPAGECFLFTQKYYTSLYAVYRLPLTVKQATSFRRAGENSVCRKVVEKLPGYLRYAEKYSNYIPDKKPRCTIPERRAA